MYKVPLVKELGSRRTFQMSGRYKTSTPLTPRTSNVSNEFQIQGRLTVLVLSLGRYSEGSNSGKGRGYDEE